jgi:DNA-binding transcriptional MerR regulator
MNNLQNNLITEEHNTKSLYPIREVARLTGINPITLRAWERRYDLVEPIRTESGHRLYSREHIQLIQKAMVLVNEQGVPISQVKQLLEADNELNLPTLGEAINDAAPEALKKSLISAIRNTDQPKLHSLLEKIFSELPFSISAHLLIQTFISLEAQNESSNNVGKMLFDSLLQQRLQARLHYLQQQYSINRQTLLIQTTASNQPKWLSALVAHFIGEYHFNVVLLDNWVNPDNLLDTLKALECDGICLVDPILSNGNLSIWEPWLKKHATLNNLLFGSADAKQHQDKLGACRIRELNDWFKPLK